MRFGSLCLLLVLAVLPVGAQQRAHIYMSQLGGQWNFPVAADSIVDITVDDDLRTLQFNVTGDMTVPFAIG